MAKAVKSIRISDTMISLLESMEEYYKILEEKPKSASQLYYDCLLYGADGILDRWQRAYGDKIKIGPDAIEKGQEPSITWYSMRIRAKALQVSLDPRMGYIFSEKFLSDMKGDKGNIRFKVGLEFDKSWETRGHLEWKWILKKCCFAKYVTEQNVDMKKFKKNAKERLGTLIIELDGQFKGKTLSREWMLYYAKILLSCESIFLDEFGIAVKDVQWIEDDKQEATTESSVVAVISNDTESTADAEPFSNPGDSLKSLRIDQEFLDKVQQMCDIEDKLLGQYVALNNMLVSMLRYGVMERIHMLQNIANSMSDALRLNGCEQAELQQLESWMKDMIYD